MKDKIINWTYDHPYMSAFLFVVFIGVVIWSIFSGIKSYSKQRQMEQAKTADFVMYKRDGEKLEMEQEVIVDEVIVDMDTGYQYLVFNIHGDYVIAPRVSEDGSFYKTVE